MKIELLIIPVLVTMLASFPVVLGADLTCSSCTECSDMVGQNISVALSSDIVAEESGVCIDMNGMHGATLDCQNHTITGMGNIFYGHTAVNMYSGSGSSVESCEIDDFFVGIDASQTEDPTFEDITVSYSHTGLELAMSKGATILNSNISYNTVSDVQGISCSSYVEGLYLTGGPLLFLDEPNELSDQVLSSLWLCGAHSTNITSVEISGGSLHIQGSDDLRMKDVNISDVYDVTILDSAGIEIEHLSIINSSRYGLDIFNVSSSVFKGMSISSSSDDYGGLRVSSSNISISESEIYDNLLGILLQDSHVMMYDVTLDNEVNLSMEGDSSMEETECLYNKDCDMLDFCGEYPFCTDGFCSRVVEIDDGIDCTIATCYEDNSSIFVEPYDDMCDDGDPNTEGICDMDLEMCVFENIDDESEDGENDGDDDDSDDQITAPRRSSPGPRPSTPTIRPGDETEESTDDKDELSKTILVWDQISQGEYVASEILDDDVGIRRINISVQRPIQNVEMTFIRHDEVPPDIDTEPPGRVYGYIEIVEDNLGTYVEKAIVEFSVRRDWMNEQELKKEEIVMSRYTEGYWNELGTEFLEESGGYYHYEATLNTFSFFSIGEKRDEVYEEESYGDIEEIEEDEEHDGQSTESEEISRLLRFKRPPLLKLILSVLVFTVLTLFFVKMYKHNKTSLR